MNATTQDRAPLAAVKASDKAGKAAAPATGAGKAAPVTPATRTSTNLAQYKRNCWLVYAAEDARPEDFEDPAMWILAGSDFSMHDRVEIAHSKWWVEGIVCEIGAGHARIVLLQRATLPTRTFSAQRELPSGYEIRKGKPGQSPFIVVRTADDWVLDPDAQHRTFEDARRTLIDHPIFASNETRHF